MSSLSLTSRIMPLMSICIRFLYSLFVAVDGNFKLKGKQRNLTDVELMPGWGAYVPEAEYKAHIANYVDEPEVSAKYLSENLPATECL